MCRDRSLGKEAAIDRLTPSANQIVPIGASAMWSSKLVKGAKLTVYEGGDHGMCSTRKDRVNADLLMFFES